MSESNTDKSSGYCINLVSMHTVNDNPLKTTAEEFFLEKARSGDDDESIAGLPEQDEPIMVSAQAQYMEKNGVKYIKYKEYSFDTTETLTTVIKIENENKVTIIKLTDTRSQMVVSEGEHFQYVYSTPFGGIPIDIYGRRVRASVTEDGGMLELIYTLDFEGGHSYNNFLRIELTKVKDE